MNTRRRYLVLLLAGLSSACTTVYQSAHTQLPSPLPAEAFERVVEVVSVSYPRLRTDAERFELQSDWIPCQDRDAQGRRRLTMFLDPPAALHAIVEVQYLYLDLSNLPYWTPVRGHQYWEAEILRQVDRAFD